MYFKQTMPLTDRINESKKIINKYPNKIPIIIETKNKNLILKKNKFLVPYDQTIAYLITYLRKQIKIKSSEAIFLFCDNKLLSGSTLLSTVYDNYKTSNNITEQSDQFLYISVNKENSFG